MIVSPHPDDAEFGAGGTVARWTRESNKVVYVICTDGSKGTSDRNMKPEVLSEIREAEQREAARMLGVSDIVFLRYPDQGLEDTSDFRKDIVREIRKYRPKVVVTADPYRKYLWHRDHRITGQVLLDAVFPFARDHLAYPDLLEQGLEPHKVEEMLFWGADEINYRSDISGTFDLKMAALQCHKSQVGQYEPEALTEWVRQRAIKMAEGESFELAEAFHRVEILY
ncbi:MAG: PIG-L family deacetylase [Candidatus Abyssobacteria bacterium SURF_5]|uniref:PIG-L family deacetylase n=1 Tax=Abyssobacteria bacterium (strain SURF_5) TaxID=2093360 RepID=A0A3A4N4B6_ABYX5|nr:MAG: PIG-L family deacetylase [Candidatus Abyssubacteria bacterium SURF_5]